MKLLEIALTPPIVAISAMFLALTGSVRAEIPTTLEPGTAYVVNCETGNAPAKIYVENASLTLENKTVLNFANTTAAAAKEGGGTNFLLRVTGGSVVTNYSTTVPTSCSRILVEEGSVFHIQKANTYLPRYATTHDVVVAVTNADWFAPGNLHFLGTGGRYLFHDFSLTGKDTIFIRGVDNVFAVSGSVDFGKTKKLNIAGTNNWFRVADNTRVVFGLNGGLSGCADATNGIYVGRNAFLYYAGTGLATDSVNTRIVVDEGGCLDAGNGDGGGMFGMNSYWITTNGTFSVSNNAYNVAYKAKEGMSVHLELYGHKANVYAKNLRFSHTVDPTNLTVKMRPGATGYAQAPLQSGYAIDIHGGIFDIDMREAIQSVKPGEMLRVPIAKATTDLNISDLDLLNRNAILKPDGARLEVVQAEKTLYFVARRQKGLVILVR